MIAVLTLVIGALAIWGYGELSVAAKLKAKSETKRYLDTALAAAAEKDGDNANGA